MATTKKTEKKTTTEKPVAKAATKPAAMPEVKAPTKPEAKKPAKPKAERDRFGSRPTTESGQINAAMTTKPQTIEAIASATKLSTSRVRNHMKWLMDREHVTKTEEGYKVAK